jgi:hypothetical protein
MMTENPFTVEQIKQLMREWQTLSPLERMDTATDALCWKDTTPAAQYLRDCLRDGRPPDRKFLINLMRLLDPNAGDEEFRLIAERREDAPPFGLYKKVEILSALEQEKRRIEGKIIKKTEIAAKIAKELGMAERTMHRRLEKLNRRKREEKKRKKLDELKQKELRTLQALRIAEAKRQIATFGTILDLPVEVVASATAKNGQ